MGDRPGGGTGADKAGPALLGTARDDLFIGNRLIRLNAKKLVHRDDIPVCLPERECETRIDWVV